MLPGAPPPPSHQAVEPAPEFASDEHTHPVAAAAAEQPADEPVEDGPCAPPLELIDETIADEDLKFDWYILKVQVNREDSIKDALWRRVKMNGLERYFKEIIVPTEDVVEFTKTGKKRTVKRKLYPGYILVNMAGRHGTWFVISLTSCN